MTTEDELAIQIRDVSKEYRLGTIGHGTLNRDLQSWWAKKTGKDDPNAKLFEANLVKAGESNSGFMALQGVDLNIRQGDIVGVIGRNGSGKSTLLKLLSRITTPTTGEIRIHGRVSSLLEVGTGFHAELTGRENVYLNGAILGMDRKEIDQKFDEIVAFSEMEKFIDTPVKRYSSGMTVRLAFAVAAHLDSEVLIIDEVLAVGDIAFKKKCLAKIEGISKSKERTVLFVSHDMSMIMSLCKSVVVLDKGRVIFQGNIRDGVSLYLGQNESKRTCQPLEWVAPRKVMPFHEVIRLSGYRIVDKNNTVILGLVRKSQSCRFKIEFEVVSPDSRVILQLTFFSADHQCLFVTNQLDAGVGNNLGKIERGNHKFYVNIPEFMMSGEYSVELLCALHHTGWVLGPNNQSRIMFDYLRDEDQNPYVRDDRQGVIAPILNWELVNGGCVE